MSSLLSARMRRWGLTLEDQLALDALPAKTLLYDRKQVVAQGTEAELSIGVVGSGFISGRTSDEALITCISLPGDLIDRRCMPSAAILRAHVSSRITWFRRSDVEGLCAARPGVAIAFWKEACECARRRAEWSVNIRNRQAPEAMAWLLCTLAERKEMSAGVPAPDPFVLPFRQRELAAALGISLVHTNKRFRALERAGLVESANGSVKIVDRNRLAALAGLEISKKECIRFDSLLSKLSALGHRLISPHPDA